MKKKKKIICTSGDCKKSVVKKKPREDVPHVKGDEKKKKGTGYIDSRFYLGWGRR